MKILLINPPGHNLIMTNITEENLDVMGSFPPLGLMYIASYIMEKSNYKVEILDSAVLKMSYPQLEREIRIRKPDIVGISALTPKIVDSLMVAEIAKQLNQNSLVVLGGHHPTLYPKETLKNEMVDFVILGEGEKIFLKLIKRLETKESIRDLPGIGFKDNGDIIINYPKAYIEDLDSLPFPNRKLVPYKKYYSILGKSGSMATAISSRGCPFQCSFCYTPFKSYRTRTPENIVDEIEELILLGLKEIFFFDDLFNINEQRVIEISKEIIKRRLDVKWSFRARINQISVDMLKISKKAGCERIHFGIETSTDKELKSLNKETTIADVYKAVKLTKKYGIISVGSFMIGLPEDTKETIHSTFNFAKKLALDFISINILQPLPYTKLYMDGIKNGMFKYDYWQEFAENPLTKYVNFIPQLYNNKLTRQELQNLIYVAYKQFYLRPSYIIQGFLKIKNFNELIKKFRGVCFILRRYLFKD